jgi:methionine biosynthesis protein MetW
MKPQAKTLRPDLAVIATLVPDNARVLDVGCGDGALLEFLAAAKSVDGRGVELLQQNVNACVARGLSVVQGDADTDLSEYPSQVFDIVILSQTIQATYAPRTVLSHLLRIGRRTIVSFPNFGHWRVRLSLLLSGRMPQTAALGYAWYDTPNIHLCTIRDFTQLVRECGGRVEHAFALSEEGSTRTMHVHAWGPNLFAEGAIFVLGAGATAEPPAS